VALPHPANWLDKRFGFIEHSLVAIDSIHIIGVLSSFILKDRQARQYGIRML